MDKRALSAAITISLVLVVFQSGTMVKVFPIVRADNWAEVFRIQGQQSTQTEPFTVNCAEWRIRWQFEPGHWHFPQLHTFSVTLFPQGETINYIDQINELANGTTVGWHIIRNHTGTFYMKISTGIVENYTVIVEQNLDSNLTAAPTPTLTQFPSQSPPPTPLPTLSPSPTPTESPTPTPSASPTNSPTPQPTTEPTQTPDRPKISDFAPVLIPVGIIFLAIIAVSLLVILAKRRREKQ
jgi:hypothetical protein